MKKMNRRSTYNKRERHSETARILLDSYHWEWDQRMLLEIAAQGFFTVENIREMRWNQLRRGFQTFILKEKEMILSPQAMEKLEECLDNQVDLLGEPRKTPEDKLFTHQTGKEIYKEIISYKG